MQKREILMTTKIVHLVDDTNPGGGFFLRAFLPFFAATRLATMCSGAWQTTLGPASPILIYESVEQPVEIDGNGNAFIEPGETCDFDGQCITWPANQDRSSQR